MWIDGTEFNWSKKEIAAPYAIMRRVYPYRGENSGPGKDDRRRA